MTDSDHKLLPLHFSFDPGPDFEWESLGNGTDTNLYNGMSYNSANNSCLGVEIKKSENLGFLMSYLELVKVPLPDWLIDHSGVPMQPTTSSSPTQPQNPVSNIPSNQPKQNVSKSLT